MNFDLSRLEVDFRSLKNTQQYYIKKITNQGEVLKLEVIFFPEKRFTIKDFIILTIPIEISNNQVFNITLHNKNAKIPNGNIKTNLISNLQRFECDSFLNGICNYIASDSYTTFENSLFNK